MDVQTPTKLSRNAPCHCGSGRKYKKCCEKKEQKMEEGKIITGQNVPVLKNDFRKEVRDPYAGISKEELVTRDQAVLLRELRFRVGCGKSDVRHIRGAIEGAKALRMELLGLPKSPYREECLKDTDQYIKQCEEKVARLGPATSMVLQLLALEELFTEEDEIDEVKKLAKPFGPMINPKTTETDDEAEDELTIPDEQSGEDVDKDEDAGMVI